MATPIIRNNRPIGVLIVELAIDTVNTIMTNRSGMGDTGEVYLVGSDRLMRSDTHRDPQHHNVQASFENPAAGRVDTDASKAALSGETGRRMGTNY